jgi:hypothetical protein
MDKVLQASLPAVVSPAIVTLSGYNSLDGMEDVLLVHITKGVCKAGERLLSTVRTAKTTSHHQIVTLSEGMEI